MLVFTVAKTITGIAASAGAGMLAANFLTPLAVIKNPTLLKSVAVLVGGAALGGVAGKAASDYTDEAFDSTEELFAILKNRTK